MSKAIVTGGANGLGLEFIKLLLQDGYEVYSIDISQPSEETRTEFGDRVHWMEKDLSIQGISEKIFRELGNEEIEVLINNAGFGTFGVFSETDWNKQQAMINLHVMTTAHLTHLFMQGMIERGKGHILNLASLAAFQPGPLMSQYYATKAYVMSFTEALANELKGTGVTATVLCPGQTHTKFQQTVSAGSRETKMSFNIASAESVARKGYKAMKAGKVNLIPGRFNNLLAFVNRLLPRKTSANIIRNLQEKNREK